MCNEPIYPAQQQPEDVPAPEAELPPAALTCDEPSATDNGSTTNETTSDAADSEEGAEKVARAVAVAEGVVDAMPTVLAADVIRRGSAATADAEEADEGEEAPTSNTVGAIVDGKRSVREDLDRLLAEGAAVLAPMKSGVRIYHAVPKNIDAESRRALFTKSGLPMFVEALEYDRARPLTDEEMANLLSHFFDGDDLFLIVDDAGHIVMQAIFEDKYTAAGEHFAYGHAAVVHPSCQKKGYMLAVAGLYYMGKQYTHMSCCTQQAVLARNMSKGGVVYPVDAPPTPAVQRMVDKLAEDQGEGVQLDKQRMVFPGKYHGTTSDVTRVVKDPKTKYSEKFFSLFDRAAGDAMLLVYESRVSQAAAFAIMVKAGADLRGLRGWRGSLQRRPLQTTPAVNTEDIIATSSWVKDSDAPACMIDACGAPFTLTRRRHHCRACGHVICGACSKYTAGGAKGKKQRVCVACTARLLTRSATVQPAVA